MNDGHRHDDTSEKLKHLNAILRAIRKVNQTIVKEKDRDRLIRVICNDLVETRGYHNAWITLLDKSGTFLAAAEAGLGDRFTPMLEMLKDGKLTGCGRKAISQSEPVVIQDPFSACADCPLSGAYGHRGSICVRLEHRGEVHGLLAASMPLRFLLEEEEKTLFKEVAGDIAFALYNLVEGKKREDAEAALLKSEKRFRTLVEYSPMGLSIMNPDNTFEYVNPTFTEMTGYTIRDVPDKQLWLKKAYPDEQYRKRMLSAWREKWDGKIEPGKTNEGEFSVRCKDGQDKIIHFKSIVLDNGQKVCSCEDTSGKRNLELQLQQAQKMEAIGRLSGGIAHDFNNLLTTMMGMCDLVLLDLEENNPMREDLLEIKKAGKRAALLTRQLLAFGRRQLLRPEVIKLNTVVEDMGKMLRRVIGEDIELVVIPDEKLGNVEVDRSQIEQVIMNLAINSRDAMPGGGKLIIETANVELDEAYAKKHMSVESGSYVMLAITDTGCGMDDETQSHIFEPFFSTKDKAKGTGLGLSTVYGIVKQSDGNIWVYSEPGKGTTFKIYFPRVEKEEEISVAEAAPSLSLAGSETILVVEDENMVRKLACRILRQAGYTVLSACYGEEALHIESEHKGHIHLIITDIVMPRMSGKELAERLLKKRPGLKVLYMSGYTDNAIVNHGVLQPGTVFLQKPFSQKSLLKKVREVLGLTSVN